MLGTSRESIVVRAAVSDCGQAWSWAVGAGETASHDGRTVRRAGERHLEPEWLHRKSHQVPHCAVKVLSESRPVLLTVLPGPTAPGDLSEVPVLGHSPG